MPNTSPNPTPPYRRVIVAIKREINLAKRLSRLGQPYCLTCRPDRQMQGKRKVNAAVAHDVLKSLLQSRVEEALRA
jgi:hypothetical protein